MDKAYNSITFLNFLSDARFILNQLKTTVYSEPHSTVE